MDVATLILEDHAEQRKMFAVLDEIPRDDTDKLAAVWHRLSILLEVHAEAEETLLYPRLLDVGRGSLGHDPADETEDAVHDHNEIRDAVRRADEQQPGSDAWWAAVLDARKANSDHMGEEEREALADFRRNAAVELRHEIGVAFAAFEAAHASGVPIRDKRPDRYVDEHDAP